MQLGGYVLPDPSTLLTSHLEEQELYRLREQAIVAHKTLQDERKQVRKLMTTFGTIRGFSNNNLQMVANCLYGNYLAEPTLKGHSDTPTRDDIPLVTETDGKIYPKNPTNGYISRFPDEFTGYLDCGSPDYRFRSCPRNSEKIHKYIF